MSATYGERETTLATVMTDRADWEKAIRRQRQLAVAADAELRRRHPGQPWPALRSAEPPSAGEAQDDGLILAAAESIEETRQRIEDLAARHREFADKLASRQSLMIPAEDPDLEDLGPAFPAWRPPGRDAIRQPPRPQIPATGRILEHITGRDPDMEAAD